MSAKVIPFAKDQKSIKDIVNEAVSANLSHLEPQVLHCLKGEVEKMLEKHFNGEPPEMTIQLPSDLTEEQFLQIRNNFDKVFHEHNERMIQRANAIFLDLYLSRLEYCELKYGQHSHPPN